MARKIFFVLIMTMFLPLLNAAAEEEFLTGYEMTDMPRFMEIKNPQVSLFSEGLTVSDLYNTISEGIVAGNSEIDIRKYNISFADDSGSDISYNDLATTYCTAVYNHPEYADLTTGYYYYYIKGTTIISKIKPVRLGADEYDETAFREETERVYSEIIKPGMSDIDKILSIHDYLADTIIYDPDYKENTLDPNITAYGALVNQVAICQGYSLAFKMLCDKAGVECGYAVSYSENHMWNVVGIDGNYYHIDVTHDDPVRTILSTSGGQQYICTDPAVIHKYFLISDSKCAEFRSYSDWISTLPACGDDLLYESLPYSNLRAVFKYDDSRFWYEEYGFELKNGVVKYVKTGKYYRQSDSGEFFQVTEDEYLPTSPKNYNMTHIGGRVRIVGEAGGRMDLYKAVYDEAGFLTGIEKQDIVLGNYGYFTADPEDFSKLMLFEDNTIRPLTSAIE